MKKICTAISMAILILSLTVFTCAGIACTEEPTQPVILEYADVALALPEQGTNIIEGEPLTIEEEPAIQAEAPEGMEDKQADAAEDTATKATNLAEAADTVAVELTAKPEQSLAMPETDSPIVLPENGAQADDQVETEPPAEVESVLPEEGEYSFTNEPPIQWVDMELEELQEFISVLDLMFDEDGEVIALVKENEESSSAYEWVVGTWYPEGQISFTRYANPIGAAICMTEDENGVIRVGLNGYTVAYAEEFTNAGLIVQRMMDHLAGEFLADHLFDQNSTYNVLAAPTADCIEVVRMDNENVMVAIPDRDLTTDDFLSLVDGLKIVK